MILFFQNLIQPKKFNTKLKVKKFSIKKNIEKKYSKNIYL